MKKHIFSKLSVFILIAATLISVFAITAAAADVSAQISSNRTSVKRGQEIAVSVKLNNATSVKSLGITFAFDSNIFEAMNDNATGDAGWKINNGSMPTYDASNKKAGIGFMSATNISGEIFVLTLKVKENATLGNQTISATVRVTTTSEKADYPAENISVKIECAHTGGTATCTEKATCSICGEKYGDVSHKYNQEVAEEKYICTPANCSSAAVFYKSCVCGAKGSSTFTHGDLADHVFTENTEKKYLKTPASCSEKAVYVESCVGCGMEGTKTFTSGDMLEHSFGSEWKHDISGHWNECSICGAKSTSEAHIWDLGLVTKAATESEEGVKTYTCTKCYVKKTESIPVLEVQSVTEGDSTVWIVVCAIEAVAIVALVVALVLKKPAPTAPVEKEEKKEQPSKTENKNADQPEETKEQKDGDDINTNQE